MTLLEIFGVKESYKLPDAIMTALLQERGENILDDGRLRKRRNKSIGVK